MAEHWLYLLPSAQHAVDEHSSALAWCDDGPVRACRLFAQAKAWSAETVVLVLPMEAFGACRAASSSRRRPGREALGFAVEEQLATPIESLHLAFADTRLEGAYRGLAVAREWFAQVLTLVRQQGLEPRSVHVDADLLNGHDACALWLEGRWLVGGRSVTPMVCHTQDMALVSQGLPPLKWLASGAPREISALGEVVECDMPTLFAQGRGQAIDLRQGAFTGRRWTLPWNGMLATASLVLTLFCVADQVRLYSLQNHVETLRAQALAAVQRMRPGVTDLSALSEALQTQASTTRSTAVMQLARLAEQVVSTGNVRLEQATFEGGGAWRVALSARDFTDMERLQGRLPDLKVTQARQSEVGVQTNATWEALP